MKEACEKLEKKMKEKETIENKYAMVPKACSEDAIDALKYGWASYYQAKLAAMWLKHEDGSMKRADIKKSVVSIVRNLAKHRVSPAKYCNAVLVEEMKEFSE